VNLVHGKFLGMEMDLLPVFNIADGAIAVGIIAIILFQRRFFRYGQAETTETNPQEDQSGKSEISPILGSDAASPENLG
jgi:hypothetical protein